MSVSGVAFWSPMGLREQNSENNMEKIVKNGNGKLETKVSEHLLPGSTPHSFTTVIPAFTASECRALVILGLDLNNLVATES